MFASQPIVLLLHLRRETRKEERNEKKRKEKLKNVFLFIGFSLKTSNDHLFDLFFAFKHFLIISTCIANEESYYSVVLPVIILFIAFVVTFEGSLGVAIILNK